MLNLTSLLSGSALLLIVATCIRSGFNLVNLISNIKWVARENSLFKKNSSQAANEKYIICIPMLREQRVLSDTLEYFSHLNYPKNKYEVIIVTTEKENRDKDKNTKLLNKLAESTSKGENFKTIKEEFLGIFPANVLEAIYKKYRSEKSKTILKKLKDEYAHLPSTFALASEKAKTINKRFNKELIKVLNYPQVEGVMSHQINYAIKQLARNKENSSAIFAVYNADSRPNTNSLKYVSYALGEFIKRTGKVPNIVQQSSLFTLNYGKYPKNLTGYILRAAALFQTKWTLVRELTRFRSQSEHVIKPSKTFVSRLLNTKISHCVGHGLFVRFNLLAKEYLPTETINEDLPFGFYQCCKGEPILPLPILENSETPETLKGLINQKRFWFTPYLQYLGCRDRVLRLKKYRSRLEVEILTIQAVLTGFVWFIQSFVLFLPPLIALYLHSISLIIMWIFSIIFYWFLPVAIIYTNLTKLEKIAGRSVNARNLPDHMLASVSGFYILLIHSLGPILCVNDFLLAKLFDKQIIKLKTER